MITVIIPTVDGREESLARCKRAYEMHSPMGTELMVIKNQKTCGIAWQMGADLMNGEYLHFSADDLEPHERWWQDAVKAADAGFLPAPMIYGPDGRVEEIGFETVGCTRIPFCTRAQWMEMQPMLPLHYYTDNWFSVRGEQQGFEVVEVGTYTFNHHWAQAGRYGGERMAEDKAAYIKACQEFGIT